MGMHGLDCSGSGLGQVADANAIIIIRVPEIEGNILTS